MGKTRNEDIKKWQKIHYLNNKIIQYRNEGINHINRIAQERSPRKEFIDAPKGKRWLDH